MIRRTDLNLGERLVQLFKKYERGIELVLDSHAIHFRIMSGRSVKVNLIPDTDDPSAFVFVISFFQEIERAFMLKRCVKITYYERVTS